MEKIKGHIIHNLPVSPLRKVADLIEYEGPILSHFVTDKNDNYLYYWVDVDKLFNRWLVWKVTDLQLYKYLKGFSSLKEIMEEPNKDFIYSIEIDNELKYNNVLAIELADIPDAYQLEENSNYSFEISSHYNQLLERFERSSYLAYLRELALYFTLEPTDRKYSTTIAAIDAGNFLRKFSTSFLGFVEEDFLTIFKDQISDSDTLRRTIQQFKEELSPRIVELEYGSFKVGISTDVLSKIESERYNEWQKIILQKYKSEVIDIDYSNEGQLKNIATKYSEEARRKIYAPYIEIINDGDYKLKVNNFNKSFRKSYSKISKEKEAIIIPKSEKSVHESDKIKLFSVILEMHEGDDVSKISKKALQTGMLFSQELDKASITINEIVTSTFRAVLNHPIQYLISIENNKYKAESIEFAITVEATNKESLIDRFQQKFIENYINLQDDISQENVVLKATYIGSVKGLIPIK